MKDKWAKLGKLPKSSALSKIAENWTEKYFHFLLFSNGLPNTGGNFLVTASYVKVCKKSEPDFDACLLNTVETLRPRLNKGKQNCPSDTYRLRTIQHHIPSHMTPILSLPTYFFKMLFTIVLPPVPRPPKPSADFRNSDQYVYFMYVLFLPYVLHVHNNTTLWT